MFEIQAIIWREEDMFVIKEIFTGVTTQGKTIEDTINNLKEALELYLEEIPEVKKQLLSIKPIGAVNVEIV